MGNTSGIFLLCTIIIHSVLCKHERHYWQPAKFSLPWPRPLFRVWNNGGLYIFIISLIAIHQILPLRWQFSWQLCEAVSLYASSCFSHFPTPYSSCFYSSFLRHGSLSASASLCHGAHPGSRWELQHEAFSIDETLLSIMVPCPRIKRQMWTAFAVSQDIVTS